MSVRSDNRCCPSHNSRLLVGLFLFSGDQGGVEQKNRVRPYFVLSGSAAPEEEVLHDLLKYHRVFTHASWICEKPKREDQTTHITRMRLHAATPHHQCQTITNEATSSLKHSPRQNLMSKISVLYSMSWVAWAEITSQFSTFNLKTAVRSQKSAQPL